MPQSWLLPRLCLLLLSLSSTTFFSRPLPARETLANYQIGLGKSDITPTFPVRLSGFGGRRTEHEGIRQSIFVKCMAISDDESSSIHLLMTIDNLGVPEALRRDTLKLIQQKHPRVQSITICSSHTHTAPMLTNVCPTLFGVEIPKEHQQHIDQYTDLVRAALIDSATQSLSTMEFASLQSGVGLCTFAANRRTVGGPVDHDLPFLIVRNASGQIRAIFTSYACHCVTLSDNRVSGDWAGYAQEAIERRFPGAMAMVAIGCGADSNPNSGVTGDRADIAALQGAEISDAIFRSLSGYLQSVHGEIQVESQSLELPLQELPSRDRWQELGKRDDAIGYHARYQIAKLDRGETIRTHIPYEIQTLQFGHQLAMVFLPGEVVVDYATKIKQLFDSSRVWVHAYSNDSPCYIPSERILQEGGYEGGGAMVYYDVPVPFAPGLESKILASVQSLLPEAFRNPFDAQKTLGNVPAPPQKAAQLAKVTAGLEVQLAVAEPLITSPVAIDFGPDGRLWVAEMSDYPGPNPGEPIDAEPNYPRGRIRVLRDTNEDGVMDESSIFAADIPFPTGITVWRDGVLVSAAPSILYLPDADHDDRADRVEVLATGFGTENYQGRVNSLEYGLDGWVYGSCGLFGGTILDDHNKVLVELGDRDFRIMPDSKIMEPATGRTQQGRVRNDFDEWFGCDNSDLGRHYPIADHYLRRNPYVAPLQTQQHLAGNSHGGQLFPANPNAQRFQLSGPLGRATAACGIGIYRDQLLGESFQGNLFTCEPVNLLVHRMQLEESGSSFEGRRAVGEERSEFLSSSDPWFRPVQVRTGPDGALWVVDMSRYVIEHPRWIPENDRKQLDARAGSHLGRIYRIVPTNSTTRPWMKLDKIPLIDLPRFLDTSNGWQRDMVAQLIRWRTTSSPTDVAIAEKEKRKLVESLRRQMTAAEERTRVDAYVLIDLVDSLTESEWANGFQDSSAEVRKVCIRLFERRLIEHPDRAIPAAMTKLASDPNGRVRLQLACSLGYSNHASAANLLFDLALGQGSDPFFWTAIQSSLHQHNVTLMAQRAAQSMTDSVHPTPAIEFWRGLIQTTRGFNNLTVLEPMANALANLLLDESSNFASDNRAYRFQLLHELVRSCSSDWASITTKQDLQHRLSKAVDMVKSIANSDNEDREIRRAALLLLGHSGNERKQDIDGLVTLLLPTSDLASEALQRMSEIDDLQVPVVLGQKWHEFTPGTQSQAIDLMLLRPDWQMTLLELLESHKLDYRSWNATQRQRLLAISDGPLRAKIEKLLSMSGQESANEARQQVVTKMETAIHSLAGNVEAGQRLFQAKCGVCHRLQGQGSSVGPDLDMAASKNRSFFLTEIFDPNRNCDSRYTQQIVATSDGRVIAGLVTEDAVSISIREQGGRETIVLRSDIESFKSTGKSLMPEGLEQDLTPQNTADIIAFIQHVPIPYKNFAGNEPRRIQQVKGRYQATASQAEIRGNDIVFEPEFGNLGYWHGVDDHATWHIDIDRSGEYDLYLDYACANDAGNQLQVELGEAMLRHPVQPTGEWSRYRLFSLGKIQLEAGSKRLIVRPIAPLHGPLIDLRTVFMVPTGESVEDLLVDPVTPPSLKTPEEVASALLSSTYPDSDKTRWIDEWSDRADEVLTCLVDGIGDDSQEEYRRIPMLWRFSIHASRKNKTEQLKRLLSASLPMKKESLRHWQAVVLGGSIINGLSLEGQSPRERIEQLMLGDEALRARWLEALEQSAKMHVDEAIPVGTRYDLLRMIGMLEDERAFEILRRYLNAKTDPELQMGAVSALADIGTLPAAAMLKDALNQLAPRNRELAEAAIADIEHEE